MATSWDPLATPSMQSWAIGKLYVPGKCRRFLFLKLGWWRKPELDILGPATWYQLSQWSLDQQLLSQQRKISRGFFERFPCRGRLHHPQIPALHPLCSINQPDFFVNSSLNRFREWSLVQPTARYIRILFGMRAKHQQRTHVTINCNDHDRNNNDIINNKWM